MRASVGFFFFILSRKGGWCKRDGESGAASAREGCIPGGEAFRCLEANLLPVTKFVGNGLLIKCLGQVDLLRAPLYIAPPITRPAPPNGFPWCSEAVGLNAEGNGFVEL